MTRKRELVLKIVQEKNTHLTAEEVLAFARRQMPSIARATVYNNLNALTETGKLRRVKIAGEPDRYDPVLKPHDHLICDRCGGIVDVDLGNLLPEFCQKSGEPITGYELVLHNLCPACRKQR
jgi:Fe2+ or Zn2+ uptake regulation protein